MKTESISRRGLLKTAAQAGVLILPGSVLGLNGAVAPSDRIVLGGVGIGGRGADVLKAFLREPEVEFVAVCDVKAERREFLKSKYGKGGFATYGDMRELLARKDIDAVLIATGDRWHTLASILAARAGKDMYCEKPCSMTIAESRALADAVRLSGRIYQAGTQRRNVPNFVLAVELARSGKLGKLQTLHANTLDPKVTHNWLPAEPEPPKEVLDYDTWLGPAPWRPYNSQYVRGRWRGYFDFHGGGILEWGSHTVDLCQWANDADQTAPVEYEPKGKELHARYGNGVKLVLRDDGWLKLGSCPVRFEGSTGWVETGDDGEIVASAPALLAGKGAKVSGYPANFHIRDFLDCVKTRGQTRANADAACQSHIACHAANIALFLGRKVLYDPVKNEFIADEQANRLRSEALREPWRI